MAYTTTQRRHEIGIRVALGAGAREVLALVVGQGMRLVGIGLGIGLIGAWMLSRVLSSQLFGISARDPLTYVTVAALLGAVALDRELSARSPRTSGGPDDGAEVRVTGRAASRCPSRYSGR